MYSQRAAAVLLRKAAAAPASSLSAHRRAVRAAQLGAQRRGLSVFNWWWCPRDFLLLSAARAECTPGHCARDCIPLRRGLLT